MIVARGACGDVIARTDATGAFTLYAQPGSYEVGVLDRFPNGPLRLDVGPGHQWIPSISVRPRTVVADALEAVACRGDGELEAPGFVADIFTSASVDAAQVYVRGTACGVLTDREGRFRLSGLHAGDTLVVAHIGHRSVQVVLAATTSNHQELRIGLVPVPVSLSH
ncbi:MAG: carboxypeptidase-like regulatory domain-containing protein [Gemmatimonadota bacterium]|nr:carboxypeptidase-like regulatory domain-containing protein [Gemmatimonadota bacterium]